MNFQQVSETQFVIPVPDVDHVNHLVVFMTGQVPFPENFGGGGKYHVIFLLHPLFLYHFFPRFQSTSVGQALKDLHGFISVK